MHAGTEVGRRAKAIMDRGELVSDDVMIGIVQRAAERGRTRAAGSCSTGFRARSRRPRRSIDHDGRDRQRRSIVVDIDWCRTASRLIAATAARRGDLRASCGADRRIAAGERDVATR